MNDASSEIADQVALRRLVDAYASAVDHRDVGAVTELFTDQGELVADFYRGPDGHPVVRSGRPEIHRSIEQGLERYVRTTHVVGGHVVDLDGDTARGEATCLAHHIYERAGEQRLFVMALHYRDDYVRDDGAWRFARRELRLDWSDDRPVGAP